jgi:hypothetical protein
MEGEMEKGICDLCGEEKLVRDYKRPGVVISACEDCCEPDYLGFVRELKERQAAGHVLGAVEIEDMADFFKVPVPELNGQGIPVWQGKHINLISRRPGSFGGR